MASTETTLHPNQHLTNPTENVLDDDDESVDALQSDSDSDLNISDSEYADLADVLDPGVGQLSSHHNTTVKERIYKFQDKMDLTASDRRVRIKDKSDRATVDRALDERSIKILYKMMAQGLFSEINGVVSSGKESNVYHAIASTGQDFAVKVYMTSILQFRNRDQYVTGDWRLRSGYTKSSSWKKVRLWAEKEYRNLLRIRQCGRIPCPEPLKIKGVVLVMSFIGDRGGPAAPRLKDASLSSPEEWAVVYKELALQLRVLFQQCALVHADFSEYNILYHEDRPYLIDVSQSVEHNHPKALDFLRSDCHNLHLFLQRQGVRTLTLRELFDFIVDPVLSKEEAVERAYFHELFQRAQERPDSFDSSAEDVAFKQMYLPRNLDAVINFIRDQRLVQSGRVQAASVPYASIIGLKSDLSGPKTMGDMGIIAPEEAQDEGLSQDASSSSDEDGGSGSEDEEKQKEKGIVPAHHIRPRDESPNSRRLRKLAVKEEQRENRKTKMKKHEKKRLEKRHRK